MRQEKSKPLVLAFKAWLEQQLARVSAKATIANDIRYALNHWEGLTRFLDDGRIELDTNIVERSIRPLVLNRKNALFAGHDQGAENWACVASLIETCKLYAASIRKPTSPTCSQSWSISGPPRVSTSSCHGPGRLSAPQPAKRRDPQRGANPGKEVKPSEPGGKKTAYSATAQAKPILAGGHEVFSVRNTDAGRQALAERQE
jgi:Transposase IS66 family